MFADGDGNVPGMFLSAMTGRVDQRHPVGAWNWAGVDEDASRLHVAEIDHLAGAVRVHRPEMMEADRIAIHVFPSRVKHSTVGQDGRRVLCEGTG